MAFYVLSLLALLLACKGTPHEDSGPEAMDADADGYSSADDCDDNNSAVHPGGEELCDSLDNDCDGAVDDAPSDAQTWYPDGDGDGYGRSDGSVQGCESPGSYAPTPGDCDDTQAQIHPGAPETDCEDPTDYNCDGQVDYADADADGFPACQDCDDADAGINPEEAELCDGADNDCDGDLDESGALGESIFYADMDGDGHGDLNNPILGCTLPAGAASSSTDCDDEDAGVNTEATEICDGVDNNCDGVTDEAEASDASTWYSDKDKDGYGDPDSTTIACDQPSGSSADPTDCDDTEFEVHSGHVEVCDDGLDNDCELSVDCHDGSCLGDSACAPTLDSLTPDFGYYDESTPVVLIGSGFAFDTVTTVSVTVGGTSASSVTVLDDSTLTALLPPGTMGSADIVVTTDNGSATRSGGWTWFARGLYAADGSSGTSGNLYYVDLYSGTKTTIGPIGYAVTGMAFAPDGTLYATEATQRSGGARLLTIDITTGVGTPIGPLVSSAGTPHNAIADITFVGSRLLGWSQVGNDPVEIDVTNGQVYVLGSGVTSQGAGLAYNQKNGLLYFAGVEIFYTVDPYIGTINVIGYFSGIIYERLAAFTFHAGTLYAVDRLTGASGSYLTTIDISTGVVTPVMTLNGTVDAIASQTP